PLVFPRLLPLRPPPRPSLFPYTTLFRSHPQAPLCSTGKSWLHFRPSPVDFCSSRLAIGAATERARALAMPAGTRAQALQTRRRQIGRAHALTPLTGPSPFPSLAWTTKIH